MADAVSSACIDAVVGGLAATRVLPTLQASRTVKKRLSDLQDLLQSLRSLKQEQAASGQLGVGRAVWLGPALWREVIRQLESQIIEIVHWEKLLVSSHQNLQHEKHAVHSLQEVLNKAHATSSEQVGGLEDTVAKLERESRQRQLEWSQHKAELQAQADHLLDLLKEREAVSMTNTQLQEQLKGALASAAQQEGRTRAAEAKVHELEKRLEYVSNKTDNDVSHKDELNAQMRRLDIALAEAQSQNQVLREQLAVRQSPVEGLLNDAKRFKADNERLVALLAETREWRRLGAEMAQDMGLHYIPVHEVLAAKGLVQEQYVPLLDRQLSVMINRATQNGVKGQSSRKDRLGAKDGSANKEAAEVEQEDWSWVPQHAVDATLQAIAQTMPTVPVQPLLNLLLQLNRIWRKREAERVAAVNRTHTQEVVEIHELYRQRAPYEAVVGRTRLADLKRQLRLQAEHAKHLAYKACADRKEQVDDTKITLQLGLESVNTLSKEVKKLSLRNKSLSSSLKQHKRSPPVCDTCLSSMLRQAQQEGAMVQAAFKAEGSPDAMVRATTTASAFVQQPGDVLLAAAAPPGRQQLPSGRGSAGAAVHLQLAGESSGQPEGAAVLRFPRHDV